MSNRTIPETARVLIKAKELISDPEKWCQGYWHIPETNQRCALGALAASQNELGGKGNWDTFCNVLDAAASELFQAESRNGIPMIWVNNELGHAAVMRCFDLAISRALQQGESGK